MRRTIIFMRMGVLLVLTGAIACDPSSPSMDAGDAGDAGRDAAHQFDAALCAPASVRPEPGTHAFCPAVHDYVADVIAGERDIGDAGLRCSDAGLAADAGPCLPYDVGYAALLTCGEWAECGECFHCPEWGPNPWGI